jgi:hypothetical protein
VLVDREVEIIKYVEVPKEVIRLVEIPVPMEITKEVKIVYIR